jgi:hypothetical protein
MIRANVKFVTRESAGVLQSSSLRQTGLFKNPDRKQYELSVPVTNVQSLTLTHLTGTTQWIMKQGASEIHFTFVGQDILISRKEAHGRTYKDAKFLKKYVNVCCLAAAAIWHYKIFS